MPNTTKPNAAAKQSSLPREAVLASLAQRHDEVEALLETLEAGLDEALDCSASRRKQPAGVTAGRGGRTS